MSARLPPITRGATNARPSGGGNNSGSASGLSANTSPESAAIVGLRAVEKEQYETRIRELETLKTIAETQAIAIREENKALQLSLELQEKEKRDQYELHSSSQRQQATVIAEHVAQITKLKAKMDAQDAAANERFHALQLLKEQEAEKARRTIESLGRDIAKRQHFLEVEEAIKKELEDTKRKCARDQADAREMIANLERKAIHEKTRLKEKFDNQVASLQQKMKSLSDSLMAETTKRTIIENIRLNKTIEEMSQSNKALIHKNENYLQENTHLARQKEMLEASEEVLAKKLHAAKRVIKRLLDKIKAMEKANSRDGEADRKIEAIIVRLQEQVTERERDKSNLLTELAHKDALLVKAKEEKDNIAREQVHLLSSLDEAASFVLTCLQEAKEKATERKSAERLSLGLSSGGDDGGAALTVAVTDMAPSEKEVALAAILAKLDSVKEYRGLKQDASAADRPLSASIFRLNTPPTTATRESSRRTFGGTRVLTRFDSGEVGGGSDVAEEGHGEGERGEGGEALMPRPPHRPLTVSTGTQTVSLQKAVFFAEHLEKVTQVTGPNLDATNTLPRLVGSEVRPWGQRSTALPPARPSAQLYLKRGGGMPVPPLSR